MTGGRPQPEMRAGMNVLSAELRNRLERAVADAWNVAEAGARAALEALAVHRREPYEHMSSEERTVRRDCAPTPVSSAIRTMRARVCKPLIAWCMNARTSTGTACSSPVFSPRITY